MDKPIHCRKATGRRAKLGNPSTRRDLPPLLPRSSSPAHRPDGTRRHEPRVSDVTLRNVTNPMNIYSDFHLCRHFLGLSMNVFVGLSFARLCRLPQQELCQTNKE